MPHATSKGHQIDWQRHVLCWIEIGGQPSGWVVGSSYSSGVGVYLLGRVVRIGNRLQKRMKTPITRCQRNVLHEGTQVRHCNDNCEDRAPHAGPPIEWHELKLKWNRQVVDNQSVCQERTSGTENRQRLPWECCKEDATDGRRHDHLQHSKLTIRAIQESATKPWLAVYVRHRQTSPLIDHSWKVSTGTLLHKCCLEAW